MKYLFTIVNLLSLALAAYLGVQTFYTSQGLTGKVEPSEQTQGPVEKKNISKPKKTGSFSSHYSPIASRNLFKVVTAEGRIVQPRREIKAVDSISPSRFNMGLVGTVTGGSPDYAIIQDGKSKRQSLYRAGEQVRDAVIREIHSDHIILEQGSEVFRLEMSDGATNRNHTNKGKKPRAVPQKKTHPPAQPQNN